jgi:hypothetical protein
MAGFDPISLAVGGIGSIVGGILSYNAQEDATRAQAKSAADALAFQREGLGFQRDQWNTTQQNQAPWLAAGRGALDPMAKLAAGAGNINPASDAGYKPVSTLANPGQFQFNTSGPNADPSYQWRLGQGLNAVNSSAAARGGFFSGNTGQALMNYGQGAASQEYGNQFNRYEQGLQDYMKQEGFNADQYNQAYTRQMGMEQNQFNQYGQIAGMGQTANSQLQQAGQNYANAGQQYGVNAGNIALNQGQNQAQGYLNQAGNVTGTLQNLYNQFGSAYAAYNNPNNQNPAGGTPTNYNISGGQWT